MSRARIAAMGLAIVLSACATPPDFPDPFGPPLPAHLASSPLVLHPWNEAGHGALLTGRLTLEDGCLYVVSEDTNERWVPSFPYPGTDWDGAVVVSRTEVITIGELATFGGGEGDLTETNVDALDWVKPPDPACLIGKAWFVYDGSAPP